jgi:hypothetical protein
MNRIAHSTVAVVFSLALVAGCGGGDGGGTVIIDNVDDSTLLVVNDSDFAIEELYVTSVASSTWGPNQLGRDVLLPDEDILLTGIPCDFHDVMLVAEDGVTCELHDIDLCFDDATWVITNQTCDEFFRKATANGG